MRDFLRQFLLHTIGFCSILMLAGCSPDIQPLYDQAKIDAFQRPDSPPKNWHPDVIIQLSSSLLEDVLMIALDEHIQDQSGKKQKITPRITIKPTLELDKVKLRAAKTCKNCLAITTKISGDAQPIIAGSPIPLPFKGTITGEVALTLEEEGQLTAVLKKVSNIKLDLTLGSIRLPLDNALSKWLQEEVIPLLEPIPLSKIGGTQLPLQAIRLSPDGASLRIEALSAISSGDLPLNIPEPPQTGWSAIVSQNSLITLARQEAFNQGEIQDGIHLDPFDLIVQEQQFELQLRIWKLGEKNWWRTYLVTGDLLLEGEQMMLSGKDAKQTNQSRGAGLSDPLALLGGKLYHQSHCRRLTTIHPRTTRVRDRQLSNPLFCQKCRRAV